MEDLFQNTLIKYIRWKEVVQAVQCFTCDKQIVIQVIEQQLSGSSKKRQLQSKSIQMRYEAEIIKLILTNYCWLSKRTRVQQNQLNHFHDSHLLKDPHIGTCVTEVTCMYVNSKQEHCHGMQQNLSSLFIMSSKAGLMMK